MTPTSLPDYDLWRYCSFLASYEGLWGYQADFVAMLGQQNWQEALLPSERKALELIAESTRWVWVGNERKNAQEYWAMCEGKTA